MLRTRPPCSLYGWPILVSSSFCACSGCTRAKWIARICERTRRSASISFWPRISYVLLLQGHPRPQRLQDVIAARVLHAPIAVVEVLVGDADFLARQLFERLNRFPAHDAVPNGVTGRGDLHDGPVARDPHVRADVVTGDEVEPAGEELRLRLLGVVGVLEAGDGEVVLCEDARLLGQLPQRVVLGAEQDVQRVRLQIVQRRPLRYAWHS